MKKFKPSELPADTVIKDEDAGVWMKEESGVWGELTAHCMDCIRTVTDAGRDEVSYVDNLSIKSDDFFQDFKIIAWPVSVVNWMVEKGHYFEIDEWLERAIEAVKEEPEKEYEWRVLDSFECHYIEVNEIGQFRCNDNVFNPIWDKEDNQWTATVVDEEGGVHLLDPAWFVKQQFNKDWQRES